MGRPSKLTPELAKMICDGIKLGLPLHVAAARAGVGRSTFFKWKQRAKTAKSGRYKDFGEQLREADAVAQALLVGRIHDASKRPQSWKAAAYLLERRWPEEWKPETVEVRHTGASGGPVEVVQTHRLDLGELTLEQLRALGGLDDDEAE